MAQVRRRVTVTGRVQGVFFRDGSQQQAQQRGLTGWVRNREDGAVEALVQGSPDDVDAFVGWARQGPSEADVESVDVDDAEPVDSESGFEVR